MSEKGSARHLGGDLYIDPDTGGLYHNDELLAMGAQLARVLKFLYERMCLDSKHVRPLIIRNAAWPPDTAKKSIDETNVHTAITALRKLLTKNNLKDLAWIEGKRGWGYLLHCPQLNASQESSDGAKSNEAVRKRTTRFVNPRSLDFKDFVDRLSYGPKGPVTICFPTCRPQPSDDFDFRLNSALLQANWDVFERLGRSNDEVSGFGVTLGAVLDKHRKFPSHLHTLRYALERSGLPVQYCAVKGRTEPGNRGPDTVYLIVGADPP